MPKFSICFTYCLSENKRTLLRKDTCLQSNNTTDSALNCKPRFLVKKKVDFVNLLVFILIVIGLYSCSRIKCIAVRLVLRVLGDKFCIRTRDSKNISMRNLYIQTNLEMNLEMDDLEIDRGRIDD